MKTVVIIPCRNEAKHIKALVSTLVLKGYQIIVSDDGSMDGTQHYAHSAGATVVNRNKTSQPGYGKTLHRGIMAARMWAKPDVLVFMDGDGQHSPDDIEMLLKPILDDKADVVLGSRLGILDTRPLYRRLSNAFGTWVVNVGASQKVADAITGYWAIKVDCLPHTTEKGWGAAVENLIKCRAKGARIASVPIQALWHSNPNDNSTEKALMLGLIVLWKIIKWRLLCEVPVIKYSRFVGWFLHKWLVYPSYGDGKGG